MAKAKVTKTTKKATKKKKKVAPEWDDNAPAPERPDTIDLSKGGDPLQESVQGWIKKHQSRRPKIRSEQEPYRYHSDILRFVERMEPSPLSYNRHTLLTDREGELFLLNTKRFFCVGGISDGGHVHLRSISSTEVPIGILLASCDVRNKMNKNFGSLILINGDEDAAELNEMVGIDKCGFPTMSFDCLHQFYSKLSFRTLIKKLTDNVLCVIDYSSDERRPLTKLHMASLKVVRKNNKVYQEKRLSLKPPEFGFTLVGEKLNEEWHRPGFVLLEDTKQSGATPGTGMMHLLLGQDEDTYFGCELSEACSSIDEALRSLVPEELQERNDLVRQGEWFMVPVPLSEVPAEKDAVLLFDGDHSGYAEGEVWLPLDRPESKQHFVHGAGRVSQDGQVYVDGCTLEHEDHEAADGGSGWVTFRKNTAVRSFSQEGVD